MVEESNPKPEAKKPKELEEAEGRVKQAEELVEREKSSVEILNSNLEHAKNLKDEAEKWLQKKDEKKVVSYAKEALKQAEEVIDGARKYDDLALGMELFFSVAALFAVFIVVRSGYLSIPCWAFLLGLMGALAYSSFGVNWHFYKGDFSRNDIIYYFSRLIQGTLLAAPVYLILVDITTSQQVITRVDEFKLVLAGNVSNITVEQAIPVNLTATTAEIESRSLRLVGAACFLTGLFTRHAIEFLQAVANRLFKLPERGGGR